MTGPPAAGLAAADFPAIGTAVRVVVTDPDRLAAARAILAADLADLDAAASRFRSDSELVRLEQAAGRPVPVSPLLAEAVAVALAAAERTEGDVDPTVGHPLAALGYDRDFALVAPDGPAPPVVVRHVPSWREVRLDLDRRLLTVPAGVRLDLGATAKAWAADRSAGRIHRDCGCGVLVSLGGDIAVAGPPPPGGWTVRVQDVTGHPDEPAAGPAALVALTGGGLATSSTLARSWRRGGRSLHHILDPRTGLPAAPVWRTVSVAAGSALAANVASTAAVVRGAAAPAWLAGLGLAARLVARDGTVRTVGGWPRAAGG